MDVVLGTINTAVLIASSLTVVLSVHAAHENKQKALLTFLALTILLGLAAAGIGEGDRVGLHLTNCTEYVEGIGFVWTGICCARLAEGQIAQGVPNGVFYVTPTLFGQLANRRPAHRPG